MVSKEKRLVRTLSPKNVEIKNPIATDMFLPNSSKVMGADGSIKIKSLTKGSVLFSDGTKITEDNANLFWDDTNKRLGLGTPNPGNLVELENSIGTGSGTAQLKIQNIGSGDSHIYYNVVAQDWSTGIHSGDAKKFKIVRANDVSDADQTAISFDVNYNCLIAGANNLGSLRIFGGFSANLVSKTANYTATSSDHTIICGAGNETFTITLPAASGVTDIIYNIKNIGTGTITVDGNASETIDGATTKVISTQYDSITIQCDGSNWHII